MVDATTIILTAVCTGIGISMGNALYDVFLKDYFANIKKAKKKVDIKTKKHLEIIKKVKFPWFASLLNFFIWGLGYLYIGKRRTMGIILIAVELFVFGGLIMSVAEVHGSYETLNYSFLSLLLSAYLAYDAFRLAKEKNAENNRS